MGNRSRNGAERDEFAHVVPLGESDKLADQLLPAEVGFGSDCEEQVGTFDRSVDYLEAGPHDVGEIPRREMQCGP